MSTQTNISTLMLFVAISPWLAILCYYDSRYRRLPNVLTLGGFLIAVVVQFCLGGIASGVDSLISAFVCAGFLLIPFLLRAAGGGDVKMLLAVGAIIGTKRVLETLVYISFSGFFLAIFMIILGLVSSKRLLHYLRCAFDWRYDRKKGKENLPSRDSESVRIPFGVAIAMGVWTALIVEYFYY